MLTLLVSLDQDLVKFLSNSDRLALVANLLLLLAEIRIPGLCEGNSTYIGDFRIIRLQCKHLFDPEPAILSVNLFSRY